MTQRTQDGLVAWKTYDRHLSDEEIDAEVTRFGNEGFEFLAKHDSVTTLIFTSNEGTGYADKRLRAMGVRWKRMVCTRLQLRAKAVMVWREETKR